MISDDVNLRLTERKDGMESFFSFSGEMTN